MNRQRNYFFDANSPFRARSHSRSAASHSASLAPHAAASRINPLVNTVRITHEIHGRSYVIEVRPVAADRWRAQIARAPGGMTSLMPFYGPTPDAAATQLAGWLSRAGGPKKAV
jgi:hypothetical protein